MAAVNAIAANNRAIRHPGAREIATCKTPIDKLPAAAVNAMPAPRSTTAHYYRIVPASQIQAAGIRDHSGWKTPAAETNGDAQFLDPPGVNPHLRTWRAKCQLPSSSMMNLSCEGWLRS